jgi:hypothetical protein
VRNVVVSEYLSLDGVAEQPDQFVFVNDFDALMEEDFVRVARNAGHVFARASDVRRLGPILAD